MLFPANCQSARYAVKVSFLSSAALSNFQSCLKQIEKLEVRTEKEKMFLMESVREREDVLFCKLSGSGGNGSVSAKLKEKEWEEVTKLVNAVGVEVRTTFQVRKQYDNIKQRAKGKLDELKRPKTGGGPVPEPSACEQIYIDSHDGRPNVVGLGTFLDTEDENFEKRLSETNTVTLTLTEDTISADLEGSSATVSSQGITREEIHKLRKEIEGPNYPHGLSATTSGLKLPGKKVKRRGSSIRSRHDQLEEELLELEIKKVKMEMELLAMKKEKTRIKTETAKEQKALVKSQFQTLHAYDLYQES